MNESFERRWVFRLRLGWRDEACEWARNRGFRRGWGSSVVAMDDDEIDVTSM